MIRRAHVCGVVGIPRYALLRYAASGGLQAVSSHGASLGRAGSKGVMIEADFASSTAVCNHSGQAAGSLRSGDWPEWAYGQDHTDAS